MVGPRADLGNASCTRDACAKFFFVSKFVKFQIVACVPDAVCEQQICLVKGCLGAVGSELVACSARVK